MSQSGLFDDEGSDDQRRKRPYEQHPHPSNSLGEHSSSSSLEEESDHISRPGKRRKLNDEQDVDKDCQRDLTEIPQTPEGSQANVMDMGCFSPSEQKTEQMEVDRKETQSEEYYAYASRFIEFKQQWTIIRFEASLVSDVDDFFKKNEEYAVAWIDNASAEETLQESSSAEQEKPKPKKPHPDDLKPFWDNQDKHLETKPFVFIDVVVNKSNIGEEENSQGGSQPVTDESNIGEEENSQDGSQVVADESKIGEEENSQDGSLLDARNQSKYYLSAWYVLTIVTSEVTSERNSESYFDCEIFEAITKSNWKTLADKDSAAQSLSPSKKCTIRQSDLGDDRKIQTLFTVFYGDWDDIFLPEPPKTPMAPLISVSDENPTGDREFTKKRERPDQQTSQKPFTPIPMKTGRHIGIKRTTATQKWPKPPYAI